MWEAIADAFVGGVLGLSTTSGWGGAVHFFVYDLLKIGFLLVVVTHVMGLVNAFLPVEKVRDWIASGRLRGMEHPAAALFGAVTPFCSCSSIPLFLGFLQAGIPTGVTFSFLITSPLVNEVAVALFLGLFGWKVTLLYVGAGILAGTVLGKALGAWGPEEHLEDWVRGMAGQGGAAAAAGTPDGAAALARRVSREAWSIVRQVGPYVLIGLALAAGIHGFVPTGFFQSHIGGENPLAVPVSVILAVPMYANAAGVIPVVEALVAKGIPLGTALAFMMAVVGLSLPEAMMLRKAMKPRLLGVFFGSVATVIVLIGYGFNWVL